jgi:hypothetical protein
MDLVATALPVARDPGEELLAAAAISLLAQPRLWSGLKLPPALPAQAAHTCLPAETLRLNANKWPARQLPRRKSWLDHWV